MRLQKILKMTALIALFVLILVYSFFKTRDLFFGLRLVVSGIADNQSYSDPVLEITGQAKKAKELTINGDEIFVSPEGNFRDLRILLPGYNIITIKAKDRFGKEKKKIYKVVYNHP